jgi:hypothetical protein
MRIHAKRVFGYLLPIEWVILFGLAALLLAALITQDAPMMPGWSWYRSYTLKFLVPFLAGLLIKFYIDTILSLLPKKEGISFFRRIFAPHSNLVYVRTVFQLFVGIYICYNFKFDSLLWHKELYDAYYYRTDQAIAPVLEALKSVQETLFGPPQPYLYMVLFYLLFQISIPLTFLCGRNLFHWLGCAIALNLVLGGMAYTIVPAYGPFIYDVSVDPLLQRYLQITETFRHSNGKPFAPDDYFFVLGAMPSLHASFAVTIGYVMWKLHRGVGMLFLPLVVYHLINACMTRFHYGIDVLVGIMLGTMIIHLTNRIMQYWGEAVAMRSPRSAKRVSPPSPTA